LNRRYRTRSRHSSHSHHRPAAAALKDTLGPSPSAAATPEILQAIQASPFTSLGLSAPFVRAVLDEGYADPSPVQTEVIPHGLGGRDVLACAQTGTGKTAAFVLPMLQHLTATRTPHVRGLVLTPTRELAAQIGERVAAYGRHQSLRHAVVYGGVSQQRNEVALRAQPELVVATPGRLLDLMQQQLVRLDRVTHFVLDEADRMLDMGFVHDVRRIVAALPKQRQTLFFSATIAPAVETLARGMLSDPVRVSIAPAVTTAERVDQSVLFVSRSEKRAVLERTLREGNVLRALVFTRTKHGANRLTEQLQRSGFASAAIHGNKSQGARERALDGFRQGTTTVLVATDVAARGIDVEGVELVVNFDLPTVAESYVHRIGRTGRAGASGQAVSLCDPEERGLLADVERLIRRRIPVKGGAVPLESARTGEPAGAPAGEPAAGVGAPLAGGAGPVRHPRRYRGVRIRPIY
jgi:ATP-dependent RNA helicase RhlE